MHNTAHILLVGWISQIILTAQQQDSSTTMCTHTAPQFKS